MQTEARRLPVVPIALATSLLAAFLVLFSPLAASAHDGLIASSPAADSTVETLPAELTLTFSADLIDGEGATEVVVTDAAGTSVIDGPATVEGGVVTQPLVAEAAAGEYHVIWKVVSSDGHPTSDEFFFTVNTSTVAAAPTATPTATAAPTTEASSTPEATTTTTPDADASSGASAWIWVISIIGILIAVAVAVWLSIRARRNGASTDSDPSSER